MNEVKIKPAGRHGISKGGLSSFNHDGVTSTTRYFYIVTDTKRYAKWYSWKYGDTDCFTTFSRETGHPSESEFVLINIWREAVSR